MYTLYYAPGTASLVVHLALLEIGAPYRLEKVDFEQGAQRRPDYLRLNPLGRVPTLVMDGKPYFESAALLMILAERHPDAGLAPPPGSELRADWHQWVVFLANTFGPLYRNWFYPSDLGTDGDSAAVRAAIRGHIETSWALVDAHLADRGPYLLGAGFSGADLLATMYMRWSRNMPKPATEWPRLRRLAGLVRERPSWARLYELEGLEEWRS